MLLLIANLFLCFIPSVFSTPIPPNCTLTHNHYAKSAASVPPMWVCPEGSPAIWRQHMCDNFFNCRHSLGDEKICVDYGPSGSSNLTFIDDKVPVGALATPVVPRMYIPDLDCSAPLCVNGPHDIDLTYKAHVICRQMARNTFQWWAVVDNDENRWPIGVAPNAIRCSGHEETIQQCTGFNSMKTPYLVHGCPRLLALTCAKECVKEIIIDDQLVHGNRSSQSFTRGKEVFVVPPQGVLTSPGYPNFFLPRLDCTWRITVADKRRLLVINITVLNLQEFELGVSGETAEDDGPVCLNSYVEIGLGMHPNGNFIKHRICKENSVGTTLTAFGPRVYIRYVSGQYMGSVTGPKGFAFSYHTIDSDQNDLSALTPPMIALIAFAGVSVFLSICVGGLYIFSKSQMRREMLARRRRRKMLKEVRSHRTLPLLTAPTKDGTFVPPVICSTCYRRIRHLTELCVHYARLLRYITGIDYTPYLLLQQSTPLILSEARRRRNRSCNSNITVDLDELLRADEGLNKRKRWFSVDDVQSNNRVAESLRTALAYDGSTIGTLYSHTVVLDDSFLVSEAFLDDDEKDEEEQRFRTPKRSPKMVAKDAASAVKNFLSSAAARTNRLSIPSWRTPSPRKASTPQRMHCPQISVEQELDEEAMPQWNQSARPRMQSLSVSPAKRLHST